jgi:hypothetical protein
MRPLLALAIALVVAAPAEASTAGGERRCGSILTRPDAPQRIRAEGVGCRFAVSLAARHYRSVERGGRCRLRRPSCRIGRYRCRRTFFGNSGTRVRCRRGERSVRFIYGV